MQKASEVQQISSAAAFDEKWYMEQYPDVAMSGLSPAEHFLRYGRLLRRDPGPEFSTVFALETQPKLARSSENPLIYALRHQMNLTLEPRNILMGAAKVMAMGRDELALTLASRHLPDAQRHTLNLLAANAALKRGDRAEWLTLTNAYLAHFGIAPLQLQPGVSLLEQLTTTTLPSRTGGPLISIIMPAFNSAATVGAAARSILRQTWQNLELLIVDDASTDDTWATLQTIASMDGRVRILRNKVNVGPYVSKNIALTHAKGQWVTGHDADDWAHPQRLERHIKAALESNTPLTGSVTYMIRIRPDGYFSHFGRVGSFSPDGACRIASISCLYERDFLRNRLGYWDDVRFGADSEMISRFERLSGSPAKPLPQIGMICLDLETSLTNHAEFGVDKMSGISPIRASYRAAWTNWHETLALGSSVPLSFPHAPRHFAAPEAMRVSAQDIHINLSAAREMEA